MESFASGLKNFWYAVEFSSKVGDSTLCSFNLFGEPWILFRSKESQVGCIQDECAHRACPLSLGGIIEGTVQCAYHGWQYDIAGNCSHMPSCQQTQAFVTSLPCLEAAGLIWVWPGDEAPRELPQQIGRVPGGFKVHAELEMELPVEHGLLLENLLNLAYVPLTPTETFASGRLVSEAVKFLTPPNQPLMAHLNPYPIEMSFEPPCYVVSKIGLLGQDLGKHLHQLHSCLPADNMMTRILYRLSLDCLDWARCIPGKDRFWRSVAQRAINDDLLLVPGKQQPLSSEENVCERSINDDRLGAEYRRWRHQVENCISAG